VSLAHEPDYGPIYPMRSFVPVHRQLAQHLHRILSLLLLAWGVASPPLQAVEPGRPVRVLLITGGCCHDYPAQKELLAQGLRERAQVEVTVIQQGGDRTDSRIPLYENPNWAQGYDVVIHDECFSDVKDPAWLETILKPHRAGLPAVVLHCAMHCYRTGSDEWFKFCGVTSRRHGAAYPHAVFNREATHPVMEGFGPAWFNPAGELYWIEKVWPTARPLGSAKNRELGTDEVCIWVNDYQGTRVFGTTLGHHNETVASPTYLEVVTRGTLWAAGALDAAHLKPVVPKRVPVDLARGKATSASSTQEGHPAAHAVDAEGGTRWCAADGSPNVWWQVDLGSVQSTRGVWLDWEKSGSVYRYRVEGSTDGQAWKLLSDGAANTQPSPHPVEWEAQGVRQVRVTFLGAGAGLWGSLNAVRVFGLETTVVDPRREAVAANDALLGDVKVPEGFERTVFAAPPAVSYPVFVSAAPDGTLYVSSDKNGSLDRAAHRGSIIRLRDLDGDGRADESKLFVADVDSPRGLVWDRDRLYVLHPPHLSAFKDTNGDGIADEQQVLVKNIAFGFKDRPADHTSNGMELGIDGWLYCAIGDFGFLEAEEVDGRKLQLRGGGVVRLRPDGTGLELYSRGTRNILEAAVTPTLDVFARDNTNDGGGWDVRLHHSSALVEHGYPSLYKNFGAELAPPLADYGGGSGCGAMFLDEPGFPEGFGYALYTADWGREWIYRHRITPQGASFTADQTEFVRVPRATDLDGDASGHLYIASWKDAVFTYAGENAGFIARVSPKGYRAEALPDFKQATDAQLVELLKSASHRRRLEAQRTLLARGLTPDATVALQRLTKDASQPLPSRVAALFALTQHYRSSAMDDLAGFAADDALREFALRAMADRLEDRDAAPLAPILAGLTDRQPRVRREAANAAARLGRPAAGTALAGLLDDADPRVAHTAVRALAQLKASDACFAVLDAPGDNASPVARQRAFQSLYLQHELPAVDGLLTRLDRSTEVERRHGILVALCRLYHTDGEWKGDSWGTRPDTSGPYYQPATWAGTARIEAVLQAELAKPNPAEIGFLLGEMARHKVPVGEAIGSVVAAAGRDASLVAPVVLQLSRAERLPAGGEALLLGVLEGETSSPVLRAQAILAFLKSGPPSGLGSVLSALARLEGLKGAPAEVGQARDAFLNWPGNEAARERLVAEAALLKPGRSTWADAALWRLSERKSATPEVRAAALQAVDAGWAVPARRAQLLQAVVLANHRGAKDRVLSALSDADPQVAEAAKLAAVALKLDPKTAKPAGPLVGTLKPAEAVAAVVAERGDVTLGEQVFQRQGCAACHTVKADQPLKGPYLGNVATLYKRPELAEAILLPSKTIAQGFVGHHFELQDGTEPEGFVTQEAATQVTIRTVTAQEVVIPLKDIVKREKLERSIMPEGLAANLTVREFASLLDYLQALAK
jgi:putative membrane-bound dehydrogenase-like protein